VCVANVDAGYNAVTISVRSSPSNDWLEHFHVGAPVVITPSLLRSVIVRQLTCYR
jgi:hypothetical protein